MNDYVLTSESIDSCESSKTISSVSTSSRTFRGDPETPAPLLIAQIQSNSRPNSFNQLSVTTGKVVDGSLRSSSPTDMAAKRTPKQILAARYKHVVEDAFM